MEEILIVNVRHCKYYVEYNFILRVRTIILLKIQRLQHQIGIRAQAFPGLHRQLLVMVAVVSKTML